MVKLTDDTIFLDDFLGNMDGIEVDLGFTGLLSFVLDYNFGGVNGLDDHRGNTARHGADEEGFAVLFKEGI